MVVTIRGSPLTVACICWLVNSNGAGPTMCKSWLRGLTHYLLLDEPRTQRTVLEPRTDNLRLFRHLEPAGYRTIKEFDFPHKRSRMVMADRHHFFTEVGL